MATQFQRLGPEDASLMVNCLLGWHRQDGLSLDPETTIHEVERLLADNQGWHSWLIRQGERVVGYLVLNFRKGGLLEAHRAYVSALYVTPEARACGLNRAAHRFVADLARWLQIRVFDFDVDREDRHAAALIRPAKTPRRLDSFPQQATA